MPRANRYHLNGLVWHVTHRCHDRSFLLKFRKDRSRYRYWLYQARKRYGLCLLNFNITSNHVHLIIHDSGDHEIIERSMQLTQGRIAQEYNRRKKRLGAFWQDRYHATAIQSGKHLRHCMSYVDLNMVRAGVVDHPSQWPSAGYHEIQSPPERYRLLDLDKALSLLGMSSHAELARWQEERILLAIQKPLVRQQQWTEAVAVGERSFLAGVANRLGIRARHRQIHEADGYTTLQESLSSYCANIPYKLWL